MVLQVLRKFWFKYIAFWFQLFVYPLTRSWRTSVREDLTMLKVSKAKDDKVLRPPKASSTTFFHNRRRGISSTGKRLKLTSGSCYIPKFNIEKPEGEDAHFMVEDGCTVGVVDGVGGWAKHGIDSGVYVRQLMSNSLIEVQNQLLKSGSKVDPKKVLSKAFSNTKAQGSSTACIITLTGRDKKHLRAVNVGDSGFIIIRNGHTVYHSSVQQHCFNYPYQLGNTSEDRPTSAKVIKMKIKEGDVLVVGTDGLFDNMFESEIEETVARAAFEAATSGVGGVVKPQVVAWKLAQVALYNSFNAHKVTPFQVESEKAGKTHRGGKVDDITVIVSLVQHT